MNAVLTSTRTITYDFFEICKPPIALLVLVTTFSGMWLASSGALKFDLIILTLIGTGLAFTASGAFKNYVDREADKLIAHTRMRALPTERPHPRQALWSDIMFNLWYFAILFYLAIPFLYLLSLFTFIFIDCKCGGSIM